MDNWQTIWLKRLIFLCTLITVAFLFQTPLLVVVMLLIIHSLYFVITKDRKESLIIYLGVGVLGASAELLCILTGAWEYSNTDTFGMPYWLPLVWGSAGLFMKDLSMRVCNHFQNPTDN